MTVSFRGALAALFSLACFGAHAQDLSLFIDLDNNPATGCSVVTPAGTFSGAEEQLITTVQSVTPTTRQVSQVAKRTCVGGTFGAPVVTLPGGWPVAAGQGLAGSDAVETQYDMVLPQDRTIRVGVLSDNNAGSQDALITTNGAGNGGSILIGIPNFSIPALSVYALFALGLLMMVGAIIVLRRHRGVALVLGCVAAGSVWAAIIIDGNINDWTGIPPLATDPAGDGTPDLRGLFAQVQGPTRIAFRIDCTFNTPPVATPTTATTNEDTPVTITLAGTDAENNPLTFAIATPPTKGTLGAITPINTTSASVVYTPNANLNGPDSFTFTANDGSANSAPATVNITINPVDDPPVAVADSATVLEDAAATAVPVLTNDTDIDGGPLSIASVTQPANGVVVITGGGTGLTYAPAANYCNTPPGTTLSTFTYTLNGGSTATVSMTVTCVDDPPVAVNDAATVAEDSGATAVTVLTNDTDIDAGPKTISAVTQPTNGVVVITGGGTGLTYAPNANYCNTPPGTTLDTFTYTLAPGSSTATVTMTVTCVDDPPVAVADAATVLEDAAATAVPVLTNDTDIDGGPKSVASVTQPANGVVVITGGGTGLTYAPNANYCNAPPGTTLDTFTYTLNGGSVATVTMTVTCVDDNPTAVNDAATVSEDAAATAVPVLTNDTDPDAGPKSIASVTQPANGVVVITGGGTGLTYAPNANYCNTPPGTTLDTFTYTLAPGGSSATVTMTVTCVDDPPVAVADAATVVEDSGATAVPVLTNDTDIDAGPKTVNSVTQPANGVVVITGGGTGLTYAPNLNYCNAPPGTTLDTFTYTLNGGSTATVTMTVTCVDDPPVAVADAATVLEDSAATAVPVLTNDTDVDGGPKSIASVTQPANGVVVITGGGTGLTYQPNANYCNTPPGTTPDTFTYTLTPGSSSTTVSMSVTCIDDNPVAVNDAASVAEDSGANAINVLANDTDIDGGPKSVSAVTQPANGVVVITGGGTGLSYQPNLNYCNTPPGTTLDTFTYTITPGGTSATVTVTVTCVDDPPVAVADSATVLQGSGPNAINVLANDTDVDAGPKSVASVTQPANGTVVITGGGTGLTYQPNVGYCNNPPGTAPDVFTYTLNGGSSTTVSVLVTCDAPPVAVADAATVLEDAAATAINVLANDTDIDGGPKSIAAVTQPANGVVVITGGGTGLTYQPNANYCNTPPGTTLDTFTYTLTPGSSSTTVTVTVTCVDDPPVAVADAATVVEDSGATAVPVLTNDTDIDGGPKSVASVTQPANGAVVITGGGTGLTYAPNANYCNTPPGTTLDTFTYTLNGGSSTTVTMTVTCVDDNPVAVADAATVLEDSAANAINVLANDTDPDGGPKSVASVTQPANGAVVITGGGTGLTYQPNANYCNNPPGTTLDTFTYTLTPGSSSTTVTVTVTCVDDPPVAVADAATVLEDSGANAVAVLTNDTDIDGGPKSIASVTQPANGAVVITGGGTGLTYAPNANYCNNPPGTTLDTFTYTLTPGSSSTTVTMTVTCVNDPPTVTGPAGGPFATIGNVRLQVTNGAGTDSLLNGAADIDGPGPITVQNATYTTANNGNVTVNQATGAWTYNPAPGYTGADSFLYKVCDSFGPPACSADVTVNFTVTGTIWFIDDTAAACVSRTTGCGRLTNPYSNLAAFQAENDGGGAGLNPAAGDHIFLYERATDYVGPVTLLNNQRLIGQDATATLAAITGLTPGTYSDALPAMNSGNGVVANITSASDAVRITNGSTNTIRGLSIGNVTATGTGINMNAGATTFGTLTILDVGINTNGRALALQGGTLTATLSGITSTGGANNVSLDSVAVGTSDFGSGALSNAVGHAFFINNGTGTVTYSGSISKATASAGGVVAITGAANGGATLSGNLSCSSSCTGVIVQSRTGGTITLSGATQTLSTSGNPAVNLTNNTGATINFTGGGLAIATTSGTGFNATGGGTVSVQGAANTIASTTGTALNVANTTIGASGLTFRSISAGTGAGSAGVGISLDTTGASGGLTISGTGAVASGGTIQHKTGADGSTSAGIGIYLNNTQAVVLNRMQLNDFDNSAIVGRNVNGFTINDSVINGTIGNNSAFVEGAMMFGLVQGSTENPAGANGLQGTGIIHNTKVSGSVEHNLEFYNNTGTMNLTIDGTNPVGATTGDCEIKSNSAALGGDGVQMEVRGGTQTLTVRRCLFDDNKSQAVQVGALGNSNTTATIDQSKILRTSQGNEGFVLSNGADSHLNAFVTANTIGNSVAGTGVGGTAIFVGQVPGNATALSDLRAEITGNTIFHPTTATNHAIIAFFSSTVGAVANGRVLISGNTVTENSTSGVARGILVDTPDTGTTPAFDATVLNNSVSVGDNVAGVVPVVVQSRRTAAPAACANIGSNTATFPNGTPGGVVGVRARQSAPGALNIQQSIAPSCVGAAATVLACRNPASTTEVLGVVGTVAQGTCKLPSDP